MKKSLFSNTNNWNKVAETLANAYYDKIFIN